MCLKGTWWLWVGVGAFPVFFALAYRSLCKMIVTMTLAWFCAILRLLHSLERSYASSSASLIPSPLKLPHYNPQLRGITQAALLLEHLLFWLCSTIVPSLMHPLAIVVRLVNLPSPLWKSFPLPSQSLGRFFSKPL